MQKSKIQIVEVIFFLYLFFDIFDYYIILFAFLSNTIPCQNSLSYNYYQSGGKSMFFKMTTDSDQHVKSIEETVEQLEQNLPQWYFSQPE